MTDVVVRVEPFCSIPPHVYDLLRSPPSTRPSGSSDSDSGWDVDWGDTDETSPPCLSTVSFDGHTLVLSSPTTLLFCHASNGTYTPTATLPLTEPITSLLLLPIYMPTFNKTTETISSVLVTGSQSGVLGFYSNEGTLLFTFTLPHPITCLKFHTTLQIISPTRHTTLDAPSLWISLRIALEHSKTSMAMDPTLLSTTHSLPPYSDAYALGNGPWDLIPTTFYPLSATFSINIVSNRMITVGKELTFYATVESKSLLFKKESVSPVLVWKDPPRRFLSITPAKNNMYALLTDTLGRVLLLDTRYGIMKRMWKGMRNAQCAFLEGDWIVTSARGVVEVWEVFGKRVWYGALKGVVVGCGGVLGGEFCGARDGKSKGMMMEDAVHVIGMQHVYKISSTQKI